MKTKEYSEIKDESVNIKASIEKGLTSKQVFSLKEAGKANVVSSKSYKTLGKILFDNIFTYFNLIYFMLGFCLMLVGSYKDMFFLFVIIVNIFIGIFQQIRSKIKIDKLNIISSLRSLVVRDGREQTILSKEVVLGDIIMFKTGDQVNVDAVLLKGQIQVDESLLTGESDPILKNKGDKLLSGSFVLSGNCVARVKEVGDFCYACKLASEAKKDVKKNKSDMMSSLDKIIKVIGFTIIPFGLVLFLKQVFVMHMEYSDSVKVTVAALVGMIPEGLYLLTSIALAVSVIKLIDSKVLVHEMSCIETLARVDVLCVDKTGTITQPFMKVVGISNLSGDDEKQIEYILNAVVGSMEVSNVTAKALKDRFCKNVNWEVDEIHPFLSTTKWFAVKFKEKGVFVLGAPEFILKREDYVKVEEEVGIETKKGKRVLLLARLDGDVKERKILGDVTPICLIFIENPIRDGVCKTFDFFQKQGVNIKVISGDNPLSVFNICKKANIKNVSKFVDVSAIKTDEELKAATLKYDVFGRVTPEQKRKIVRFLQEDKKHTVAMVGDGVNDVLALRDSDVGVAMASGSDAASQAAEIVLLNSDFDSMPKVVMEGRRVINNIQRFASLFLAKNIFSFSFAFLALFLNLMFPISPFQFTFISAITIGFPSFLLTMEPSTEIVRGSFIANVLKKALPGGICNLVMILTVQLFSRLFYLKLSELSSISAILLGVTGLFVLLEICKPLNNVKLMVFFVMSILMGCCIFFVKGFTNIYGLTLPSLIFLIILIVVIRPFLSVLIFISNKESKKNKSYYKT